MVRKSTYLLLGLFFLTVMAFPLPECYLTRPDCPKRGSGPCPYSNSDAAAATCAGMSCPSQEPGPASPVSKHHANDFQPSPKSRPLYARLVTHISVRGQDGAFTPAGSALAFEPNLPEPLNVPNARTPVFISDRHPRAGPLIVLNQTFLI